MAQVRLDRFTGDARSPQRRNDRLRRGTRPRCQRRSEGGLEAVGEGLVEAGQEVTVSIQRDLDGGVAEAFHDGLGVGALGDEEGCARVPQVMEAQCFREPGAADRGLEVPRLEQVVP